ncbi:hypothetical protein NP233_g12548 [Leucocoprinus birnbaumii]|uniref:Uncharacterized protein n=1 Tax=Leucocoprinus birnbaumii TaxID=56174 RepID=A0AAD5VEB3_9AGAR|nr:hypothetical protein NP233_g12548 [Leucocoprinus birnbaumii]
MMGLDSGDKIEVVAHAVAEVFSGAWHRHAKEVVITNCSKSWWDDECNTAIKHYHESWNPMDYTAFWQATRAAKCKFFDEKIKEIAFERQHPWDLMAWVKQCNLPVCEAIAYNSEPCHDMDSLWVLGIIPEVLEGSITAVELRSREQAVSKMYNRSNLTRGNRQHEGTIYT